ncbi:MAG: hypothetical protein NQ127_00840 [Candidatus Cardinium sp.]|nr:hypothetical protein [Candidatus Cardinium sp.]
MIRLWKFLIYYSFILVLIGCENVRSGQLGMQPQSKKENITRTFRSGDTKKAKYQNKTIIRFVIMLGLLSAQLTPVNSMLLDKCEEIWKNQKDQTEEVYNTILYKLFSTLLFATKDVDTTTRCEIEASDTKCQHNCTNRLHKLLANEKIKKLMNRYKSTSNNNTAILYQRNNKIRKDNGDNYPEVAFTYKKNGTVMFYGCRNLHSYIYKSIPDEIKKIWEETNNNKKDRIKQLEELVVRLINCAFTNDPSNRTSLLKPTLEKWCNERNHDAAMGLIEAIEQIVDLITIKEILQDFETVSYLTKDLINKNKDLIQENNLLLKMLSDPYKRGCFPPEVLKNSNLQEMEKYYGKVTSNNCTISQDRSEIGESVNMVFNMVIHQNQKAFLLKDETDKTSFVKWLQKQRTGKQQRNSGMQYTGKQQSISWMRR